MHTDHSPYLAAVERALLEAGFEALDAHAEDRDPRGGAIQLDTRSPVAADWFAGWDEVWVAWDEDRGWWINCTEEVPDGKGTRSFVIDLPVPRLAAPGTVVRAVAEKTGADIRRDAAVPDADFPGHTFEDDDPEFEQALARYREATQ